MGQPRATKDAGLAYLEEEISSADKESAAYEIGMLIKTFLMEDSLSASEAAQRIDDYYTNNFMSSDPLRKFSEDKGITGFLAVLWEFISTLARLLPHDDTRQEKLIQLMLELRKIHRPARIWDEDCRAYDDPVYSGMMDDEWNDLYLHDHAEKDDEAISGPLKQRCDEWLNFATFMARTIGAGMNEGHKSGYKYPLADIEAFTVKNPPPGLIRNTRVQVAAQYVLLAGRGTYRELMGDYVRGGKDVQEWRERWGSWARKFQEVAEGEEEDPELRSFASRAYQMMVEIDSEEVARAEKGVGMDAAVPISA